MLIRKTVVAASLALGVFTLPAAAQQLVGSLTVDIPPPAPRVEVVPAPRAGYVWAPGFWRWDTSARTYIWVDGRWEVERPGYRWVADRWVPRERVYYYEPGRWEVIVR